MNQISLHKKVGLDVMQSYPQNASQQIQGLTSCAGWPGAISCTKCKLIAYQWCLCYSDRKAQQRAAKLRLYQSLDQVKLLTSTSDACIFKVCTIMNSNSIARAVYKSGLGTPAGNIVQKDGSSSLTKLCKWNSRCSCKRKVRNQYHGSLSK